MTDIDLDKLEALADAATSGPWASDHDGCLTKASDGWSFIPLASAFTEGAFYKDEKAHANAAFIAAANPSTILSLIASAREAAAEIERLKDALKSIRSMKTQPIGDTGFQTGPLALFNACQRVAKEALSARAAQMDGEG